MGSALLTLFFPLPPTFQCCEDGCAAAYNPAVWTSRRQSLQRHLEAEHGVRIRRTVNVCTICGDTLGLRPTTHACLVNRPASAPPPVYRHQCSTCSRSFTSRRGLQNYEQRHRREEALARQNAAAAPPTRSSTNAGLARTGHRSGAAVAGGPPSPLRSGEEGLPDELDQPQQATVSPTPSTASDHLSQVVPPTPLLSGAGDQTDEPADQAADTSSSDQYESPAAEDPEELPGQTAGPAVKRPASPEATAPRGNDQGDGSTYGTQEEAADSMGPEGGAWVLAEETAELRALSRLPVADEQWARFEEILDRAEAAVSYPFFGLPEDLGGAWRNQEGPGAWSGAADPLGGKSGPADQAWTHYRRSGSGPPQEEATTGRGVGKRQPPFLACLSRPGRRCCLRATTTGPGPRDRHRRHPGPPGPAAARTPCFPDLLPGPETGLGMPARPALAAAVPGPSRQRPPAPSHRRRPATSGSSSPASPPPRRPRRDDSTATDSTSSSGTPATVRPRNPTLARQEITIFFPVPRLVRCPKRGCGTSYGGSSWTARVQSLRRHLETEHGQRIRSRVYVCTICGDTIRARPSYHRCLETAQMSERPPPGQHQCDRCSQSFPSARGLYNHRTWHQTQDAAARSAGSTRPAPTGPAPQVPPLGDRAETPLLDALPQATPSPGPPSVPSPTGQASVSPLGSSTRGATSPAHDTGTPLSQPSPSQSPSTSPEPATDDGADPDEADDPPGTPPVEDPVLDMPPDHTDLPGDQARLLRQLIREPPSQDSWDRWNITMSGMMGFHAREAIRVKAKVSV
ncbi:hypothetical protein HPB52_022438 [Rhipicephalus sanguineus]|uniref:C2H2-type domain-containing protein n=1 Tax=Rhipicephalus sanguineus TaxID=34632 RepID=A0A9D4QIF8_RHISA|nr:hypothetical protein HPB52_022438 [Rhipicephalus sanguineus]